MSEKCKCGADAKYRMALSDDTCAECHIIELNEGMQRLVDAVENYYVAAYEHEEELASQRRVIATLRARLQRGSRGRQNFRGKHHKHGKRFCICGQCATRTFDALNEGHGSAWQMNHHRILHGQRIAAIRNFGALP